MNTLTLDISTHTGWAITGTSLQESGTYHLATEAELIAQRKAGKERTLDLRFSRLYRFIIKQVVEKSIQRIVFEDVQFSSTQMQGQLWASLRTAIWAVAEAYPVEIFSVPVGTLKKFATGKGTAQKEDMANALKLVWPGTSVQMQGDLVYLTKPDGTTADDNEVDAIWLAKYSQAVDAGTEDFLGVYQRKQLEKAAKRQAKAAKRMQEKAVKVAAMQLAKTIPPCCGIKYVLKDKHTASCPKCGAVVKLKTLHHEQPN